MFTQKLIVNITRGIKYSFLSSYTTLKQPLLVNRRLLFKNPRFYSSVATPYYLERENTFLFNVVNHTALLDFSPCRESVEIHDESTFTNFLNKNWRESNATDILNAFLTLQPFCIQNDIDFDDARFNGLVDGLMDHCEKLTDEQLLQLLECLVEYPACQAYASVNYHDMWSCLDDICCWKMTSWDLDKLFAFSDVWFKLKLAKRTDFIFEVLDKLVKKADYLTKDQLIRIFFYFNVCRRRPVDFEYEHALQYKIGEMNVDEIAVVALGFFKTESKVKLRSILEVIIEKVTNNAMGIHEISLTAVMKVLRFSTPFVLLPQILNMLDRIYPEIDRLSDVACLHVALLPTSMQIYEEKVLRKCSQKLLENLPNSRLKEIDRTLNVLTMFSMDHKPGALQSCLQELLKDSRLGEINQFPTCLPSSLHYLSMREIYSYELMARIIDPEFIKLHFGSQPKKLPRQIFALDACVDIECPDYRGPRLPPSLKYRAAKWMTIWAPSRNQWNKVNAKDKLFLDAVDATEAAVGDKDLLIILHVLPHFNVADIVVCKNTTTNKFVTPKGFQQYILGDVMFPFNDGTLKWYAIVVLNWSHIVRNGKDLMGIQVMKKRQLEKIGYTPVLVNYQDFGHLTAEEKVQHLKKKLI